MSLPRFRLVLTALLGISIASSALAACGATDEPNADDAFSVTSRTHDSKFNGSLLDPSLPPPTVELHNTDGQPFTIAQRPVDEVTAVFFGFTNCDDVCPTTMADLAVARRELPPALARRVVVVMVTVDPRRDRPQVLERWLSRFDDDFVGLIGSEGAVHRAERSLYAVESGPQASTGGDHNEDHANTSREGADYQVEHSGTVYVFGPAEKTVIYTGGTTPHEYAEDFTRLLQPS